MADYTQDNGKSSTFGRGLMSYLAQRLPYSYHVVDSLQTKNPKFELFQKSGVKRAELLAKNSISLSNEYNNSSPASIQRDETLSRVLYASVNNDKAGRLRDYRVIAAFSEVADALDEICDEFINKDDKGRVVNIKFHNADLSETQQKLLVDEFEKLITYFDFENRGWTYVRQFLTEGELFFENIIHKDYPHEGVLGVINLPGELIDPIYNNIQNMMVKGFVYKKPIFDPKNPQKIEKYDFIPMSENQVVYITSGIFNDGKTFILPILENARRSYRQLSLIEDAIVIYRLVRAPERLVFNVDTGNMAPPKAEAYLKRLIQQYWSSKTFDVDQNDVVNKFNPQSMLDAFWFAKRQGSEGTTVTQLPGGANLGELADLMYFIKKLYRSLKVPATRLDPQDAFKDGTEILREELKFARFIIRMQQRFAASIKKCFITHLKLKKIWDDLGIIEPNIVIEFNVPTNFYDLRENQKMELKVTNFNNLSQNESISKTFAQKKYLGWSDTEILANREFMRKDAEFMWEIEQIKAAGPGWKEAAKAAAATGQAPGEAPAGPSGGGIPAFGGGPAAVASEPEPAPPEGEEPPTGPAPETPPAE